MEDNLETVATSPQFSFRGLTAISPLENSPNTTTEYSTAVRVRGHPASAVVCILAIERQPINRMGVVSNRGT